MRTIALVGHGSIVGTGSCLINHHVPAPANCANELSILVDRKLVAQARYAHVEAIVPDI